MKYFELTKEEEKLLESFDEGAFVPVKNVGRLKSIYKKYAENMRPSLPNPCFFCSSPIRQGPRRSGKRVKQTLELAVRSKTAKIHNDRGRFRPPPRVFGRSSIITR